LVNFSFLAIAAAVGMYQKSQKSVATEGIFFNSKPTTTTTTCRSLIKVLDRGGAADGIGWHTKCLEMISASATVSSTPI
jgi:hypothetical protein